MVRTRVDQAEQKAKDKVMTEIVLLLFISLQCYHNWLTDRKVKALFETLTEGALKVVIDELDSRTDSDDFGGK